MLPVAITINGECIISCATELISRLISVAAENHTDADCLVVAAMSHGESGFLHSNDELYAVDKLWNSFTGDLCPTLAGKPKLFFIQVTRIFTHIKIEGKEK